MSSSWTDQIRRYLRARFPARLFVPCAAFLLVAGFSSGVGPGGARDAAVAGALTLGLLLQFRLMDDIADRRRDRETHPERVLPQARSLAPFLALTALAFLFNLSVLATRPGAGLRIGVFLALTATFGLWYGLLHERLVGTVAGYHVVVAKYPVLVYLASAADARAGRLLPAMALVYLCFAIHEALHDERLRAAAPVAPALALETWALFAVALAMALELSRTGRGIALAEGLLACAGLAVVNRLVGRRRSGAWPARASYLVFAVGLTLSLTYSIGGLR